ncbi:MAG: putative enzyme related to lactoylglutathione lyase [Myxococcota bacterium]|jgi:predicted enzyme related to lactoylglutathione lyase
MSEFAGRFVWRELMTTTPNKATGFYGELFGWKNKTENMGDMGDYVMLINGEAPVGGIGTAPEGVPSHWMTYVTVDDIDASVAKAKALGGTLKHGPFAVPGVGRMAFVEDPAGAVIAPFQAETPGASGDEQPALHSFCWSQLMTTDRSVESFYEGLFGWKAAPMPNGMTVFSRGDQMTASVLDLPEAAVKMGAPSHWLDYVLVEDVTASLAKANQLGATTLVDVTEVPNMGIFAILADPTGATVALWKHTGDHA